MRPHVHRHAELLLEDSGDAVDIHRAVHQACRLFDAGAEVDLVDTHAEALENRQLEIDFRHHQPRAITATGLEDHPHVTLILEGKGVFVDRFVTFGAANTVFFPDNRD